MMNVALDATPCVLTRKKSGSHAKGTGAPRINTLAVTAAVVSSTLRQATSVEQARATVAVRITALGKAHELLHGAAEDTPVQDIVVTTMRAHLDRHDRALIRGPDTRVASQQSAGLSLAVYELATNAVKYGASSNETGRIEISWEVASNFTIHELQPGMLRAQTTMQVCADQQFPIHSKSIGELECADQPSELR